MYRLLRDLALILALAGLWALGGYLIGWALEIIGFDTYRLGIALAAVNVIIGMALFLRMTKDAATDRAFFESSLTLRPGDPKAGCLWLMPLIVLIYGASMWVWALLLGLIFPE